MRDTKQIWFKEAKYGLFIHWGLYSILAGEYNGKKTDNIAEWIMNDLDIPPAEYEKLASQFNPINFDADKIAYMAKNVWGMKYICFTSKHHDGFALFHSKCSSYNVVEASPYGKDIVAELSAACKKYDLKFCLYYSQAQDWHHPDGYRANYENSHKNFRRYLDEKCLPQIREILTNYGEIGMLWFDTPMEMTQTESQEVYDLVKSIQPNCIVSGRIGNDIGEYMTTGDNDIPSTPFYGDWEVPATLNDTWGYSKFDNNWKSSETIIQLLIKINSRGGNYLLNIGPMADGTIPPQSIEILDTVGHYVSENKDSIYATKAVDLYPYDKESVFFTARENHIYLHLTAPKKNISLSKIANSIQKAYLLKDKKPVEWKMLKNCEGDSCWHLELPENTDFDPIATVVCVEIKETWPIFEPLK